MGGVLVARLTRRHVASARGLTLLETLIGIGIATRFVALSHPRQRALPRFTTGAPAARTDPLHPDDGERRVGDVCGSRFEQVGEVGVRRRRDYYRGGGHLFYEQSAAATGAERVGGGEFLLCQLTFGIEICKSS